MKTNESINMHKKTSIKKKYLPLIAAVALALALLTTTVSLASQGKLETPDAPAGVWTIESVDTPPLLLNTSDHSLRYKSDGTPCTTFGGDALYYTCFNTTTQTWSSPEVVDSSSQVGKWASLAFNNSDQPFISYYDANNGVLKVAYDISGSWTIKTIHPLVTSSQPQADTATEAKNAYSLLDVDYVYKQQPWMEKSNISSPLAGLDSGGYGQFSSIAIDGNNEVYISYYDSEYTDGANGPGALLYLHWNGLGDIGDVLPELVDDKNSVGQWTSIAVYDKGGGVHVPHIAYMSEKYDELRYAYKKDSAGSWKVVVSGRERQDYPERVLDGYGRDYHAGFFGSIAVDTNGRPHISYLYYKQEPGEDPKNFQLRYITQKSDGSWENPTKVDTNGNPGWYTSIAIDPDNKIYISYYDKDAGDLKLAKKSGSSWSKSTISSEGDVGLYTSIDIDKDKHPGIAYYNVTQEALQFAQYDGTDWVFSNIISPIADVGIATSLAFSPTDDKPSISYVDETIDTLKFAKRSGAWATEMITGTITDTFHAGVFTTIKIGTDGNPRIAFYEKDQGDLIFAKWASSAWEFTKVDTTGDVGKYLSMALDSSDNPHISYYDATNTALNYAYFDGTDWVTDTLTSTNDIGKYTSIVLNSSDKEFISFYDATNEELKLAYKSQINSWVFNVIQNNVGQVPPEEKPVAVYNDIALDSGSNPHVVYYDAKGKDLKYKGGTYSLINGVSWPPFSSTLAQAGDVGKYVSMEIDLTNDHRHLAYYNATNGDLMYMLWDGTVWSTDNVASTGNVGLYCSLALNGSGIPAISYYDASNGDLKYAYDPPATTSMYTIFLPSVIR